MGKYAIYDPYSSLKKGIWLYFILLIFEGALRKWVLPGLATPLLLVRDPIAIWLFYTAWKKGLVKNNIYILGMFTIGILGFFTALIWGHGNFLVAIYGTRTLIVHWPVIFIIGKVFDREDVLKIGKFVVWLTIPMAVLLIFQFYSPQSAWINRGIGGDTAGGGFSGALGYFRPPATFSFTNGTTLFFGLAACFIFYFWVSPQSQLNKLVLISASIALLMSIPLSISRSLFFSIVVTLAFVLVGVFRQPKQAGNVIVVALVIVLVFMGLSQLSIFQTATEAFTARFTNANEQEGGLKGVLGDRYFGGLLSAFTNSSQIPFLGLGTGMGTNVGSQLLTGGTTYLISEGEWGRLVGELGFYMGLVVIFIRLSICIEIAVASYKKLAMGNFLPWILLSFCLLSLPQGQWSQPTSLGFSVLIAGFVIAATKVSDKIPEEQVTQIHYINK